MSMAITLGSECAAADNQHARREEFALPFFTNAVEQNLSTVAIIHCGFGIHCVFSITGTISARERLDLRRT